MSIVRIFSSFSRVSFCGARRSARVDLRSKSAETTFLSQFAARPTFMPQRSLHHLHFIHWCKNGAKGCKAKRPPARIDPKMRFSSLHSSFPSLPSVKVHLACKIRNHETSRGRGNDLKCGNLSPLSPLGRLVGQAEPRSAARDMRHAPPNPTATSRLPKAVTSHRTPHHVVAAPTALGPSAV